MKRTILPTLLAIILSVIIFIGCKSSVSPYNDYDDLDTVQILIGEKLYQSKSEWTRLDSVTIDFSDTSLEACFTFYIFDSLFSKSFKAGDHRFYSFDPIWSKQFSFQCLEIKPYDTGDLEALEHQVTFIASSTDVYTAGVDKPNIYLYPTKKTRMTVFLDLPEGGKVTESIPAYPKKWKNIRVKPDGTINRKYDFLFYEADLPGDWQKDEGWVVAQKDLKFFFEMNLRDYGFNKKEIYDFTEHWIPRLNDYPFYQIYPQHTEKIEEIVPLRINKEISSLLRLFYFVEGTNIKDNIPEPKIPVFERKGFVVTEWGVSLE